MGRRDIGKHETKKPKKDAKKPIVMAAISPIPAPHPSRSSGKNGNRKRLRKNRLLPIFPVDRQS